MKKTMCKLLMGFMLPTISSAAALAGPSGIAWRDWSDEAFAAARSGKRMVLLDLGAVWCHWGHVMDETTYRDSAVAALAGC